MTLFRLLTEGTKVLERVGVPDAGQDARQLLLAAFQLDMVHFLMNRMQELEENRRNQMSTKLYRVPFAADFRQPGIYGIGVLCKSSCADSQAGYGNVGRTGIG